ncbi:MULTISPECIES: CPBP family intramembrane glutamic endopeptidase [unclassified Microbacterium]|jgi:membrane protease YdiL (CAAX protease family)|uniref:CPBP family intramembrane glutamic endopeptidase n=1 Tax=unclassified Microbacterium TaxID=2609290 RepID=UPI000E723E21|nr:MULTISPECIES: CPBP family intramembrane glutamic endopeptidase [unclassified Microbacterium]MDF2563335.1 hypothetical protein [Microbacterium sp.]RKE60552.1 hypothetical protein DEU36_2996 [Microbacterium sp. AG238]
MSSFSASSAATSRDLAQLAHPPRLGVGPLGIIVRAVVAIAILMAANLVAGVIPAVVVLIPGAAEVFGGSSPWGFALAAIVQLSVLGFVLLVLRIWMTTVERAPLRAAGWSWRRSSGLWLALGIGISALSVVIVYSALPAIGPIRDDELSGGEQDVVLVSALLIIYYLGLAFVQQSLPEELLFRGWLLWRLRDRPVWAITVTTLVFTVIHLVSQGGQQSVVEHVLYLALPLGFSLLAVGLLLWTGSLWAAVGVHGGFHVGNYIAVAAMPEVDAVSSWLAIGGVQAVIGIVLTVGALRCGRGIV